MIITSISDPGVASLRAYDPNSSASIASYFRTRSTSSICYITSHEKKRKVYKEKRIENKE
jgi:hypothetical protein